MDTIFSKIIFWFALFFFLAFNLFAEANRVKYAPEYPLPIVKRKIALSLFQLQVSLETGQMKLNDTLPLTRIMGIYLPDTSEIILLGVEEQGHGVIPIVLDDIAAAMRGMIYADAPPGVTIVPRFNGEQMHDKQEVIYFGKMEGGRVGAYLFECDYWMKQLASGYITCPLKDFRSYCDCCTSEVLKGKRTFPNEGERFWFSPNKSLCIVSPQKNAMLLANSGVSIGTEAMPKSSKNIAGKAESTPCAIEFSEQLTRRYEEFCVFQTALKKLKNFFVLCEVFEWAENKIYLANWPFFINRNNRIFTHTPSSADTVKMSFRSPGGRGYFLTGGVTCHIQLPKHPAVDNTGRIKELIRAVLSSRPNKSAVFWPFDFQIQSLIETFYQP